MNALHKGSATISISEDQAYQTVITSGFALIDRAIDDRRLKHTLMSDTCGALATFEGWVRNHNNARPVSKLTYYGYEQLALNQGKKLVEQAKAQFDIENAIAIHRVGDLAIGEMAVWVGVCLLYTSPSPRDGLLSRMPSSA